MSIGSRTIFCAHFLQVFFFFFQNNGELLWHFLLLFGRAGGPPLAAQYISQMSDDVNLHLLHFRDKKKISAAATGTFFFCSRKKKKRKCSSVRKAFQLCAADRHNLSIFVTFDVQPLDVIRRYLYRNLSEFSLIHFKWAVISEECRNVLKSIFLKKISFVV